MVERGIVEQRLEPFLLDYWRGLIQTYPWLVIAFAGLHTLREMTQDFWNPLFGSVRAIQVTFLSPAAAKQLITRPSPDFSIDYDSNAIARIIQLTNGQPYLLQLIGHTLVTRFNRQIIEEGIERERRFTTEDVDAVIDAPEFYRDGDAYFEGVWAQAERSKPAGQTAILQVLCDHQAGLPLSEIVAGAGLSTEQAQAALDILIKHDVVAQQNQAYACTVELMRRWIAKYKSGKGIFKTRVDTSL